MSLRGLLVLVGALGALIAPALARGQFPQPRAVIVAGPEGEVAETVATFEFEASGTAPLATFECRLDAAGSWVPCESPYTVRDLLGGRHGFEVRLRGRLVDSSPDRRDWTVARTTEIVPCGSDGAGPCASPLPEPPAIPPAPLPARSDRRRDARGCAYGGNEPGEVSGARIRRAVRCLVNVERSRRRLRPLRLEARLERAAAGHARDMVVRRYFAHASPGGRRIGDRVRAAGYLRGARYWSVGEVLAWLLRPRPTAAAVVDAWMDSPPHRAVILQPSLREIGVGFSRGNPRVERRDGATFAAALGRRR